MPIKKSSNKKNNSFSLSPAMILVVFVIGLAFGIGMVLYQANTSQTALAVNNNFPFNFPFPFVSQTPKNNRFARAVMKDVQGNTIANILLTQMGNNVSIQVIAKNLTPGFHGFHIHTVGKCDAPDFMTAGGHYNPPDVSHANHAGDLPVLLAEQNGKVKATIMTDRFKVSDLFDADGSAFIIHAGADNYANIPTRYVATPDATTLKTGDAGGRFACGIIQQAGNNNVFGPNTQSDPDLTINN